MIVVFLLLCIAACLYKLFTTAAGFVSLLIAIAACIGIYALMTHPKYERFMHRHLFLHVLLMLFIILCLCMLVLVIGFALC